MTYESSLRLTRSGDGPWTGDADPAYGHREGQGRFGGWTAAVLQKAAMLEPGDRSPPLSLTVLFTDAVNDGPVEVSTRQLRAGARLQFWRSELSQRGKLCAHAQATFGVRRETDRFTDAKAPAAPPPESDELVDSVPPLAFGRQFQARWATPNPFDSNLDLSQPARSLVWVRDAHGRAIDHLLLTLIADFAPPRIMFKRRGFMMSSTVSMTVHYHATPAELAEVGADFVLSEVDCLRCEGGYFEHSLRIWSRSGALLANSVQVAAYRD